MTPHASYDVTVLPPPGRDWVDLTADPLPVAAVHEWLVEPGCGGQVVFTGTVRDHAEGRDGVTGLDYEAYAEQVVPRLQRVADEARRRWPDLGRLALLHRVGRLDLGEVSVVVGAAAPHRAEAFAAARFGIDTLKATVPVWKKENWVGGSAWGLGAAQVSEVGR
jgi:molybdopterin synthase catalytic subunit